MKKVGFALAGVCALGIIAGQTLGNERAPKVPSDDNIQPSPKNGGLWPGANKKIHYEPKVEGNKFTLRIWGEKHGSHVALIRLADDRGRMLSLSGGDCHPVEVGGELSAVLENTEFKYATIYTQIYRGDKCDDSNGQLLTENATHLKNIDGDIEIIDEEEFYMNSSINEVYSVEK